MEHADLLYKGLMVAAGMLSLWAGLLATVTLVTLTPSLRKSAPRAATISSTTHHVPQKATAARSLSQALPQRPILGRVVRPIQ